MRSPILRTTALLSGLVLLAACDDSHTPLAPQPELPAARRLLAPSGLVAFYSFDNGPGAGATLQGATPTAGYEGGAYHFDGPGDFIDLPVDINPSVRPVITMGAWVRIDSLPRDKAPSQILSHDNGYFDRGIALDTRGEPEYYPHPYLFNEYRFSAFIGHYGVMGGGPAWISQEWQFVAVVYDGSSVTLYQDGYEWHGYSAHDEGFSFLRVGGNPGGYANGEPFFGDIDNVFVYDRALSWEELEGIRARGACAIRGNCGVTFYSFDTGPGNGTPVNAQHQATAGYEGGAYYFDGDGDYVDLPVNVNPSVLNSVTMGAWVKAASLPAGRSSQVLSHDNGGFDRSIVFDLRGQNGGLLADGLHHLSAFTGSGVLPGPVASTGTWTFVAAVYHAGTVTLYVNGQAYPGTGTPGDGFATLRVGGNPGFGPVGENFHGWIDNVFVVDHALTAGEIATIRASGACWLAGTPCSGTGPGGV